MAYWQIGELSPDNLRRSAGLISKVECGVRVMRRPHQGEIVCPACDGSGTMPAAGYFNIENDTTKPCYRCNGNQTIIDPLFTSVTKGFTFRAVEYLRWLFNWQVRNQAKRLKADFNSALTGSERGKVMYLPAGIDARTLDFPPGPECGSSRHKDVKDLQGFSFIVRKGGNRTY